MKRLLQQKQMEEPFMPEEKRNYSEVKIVFSKLASAWKNCQHWRGAVNKGGQNV